MKKKFLLFLLVLLAVTLPAPAYDFMVDGLCYNYNDDGTSVTVTYKNNYSYLPRYSNLNGVLTIPTSVTHNGTTYSVTAIGSYSFEGCTGLTSVTIPNTVTSIGGYAFSGCSGLTTLTIPNSVTMIYGYAFSGTAWYNNQADGLVYAGMVAYKYKGTMPNGSSIVLKNGCIGISVSCFQNCTGLTSVTIPNSVTKIGRYAFSGCCGLSSVRIGSSVTEIDNYAFSSCTGLTSVTIPNSVTSIG